MAVGSRRVQARDHAPGLVGPGAGIEVGALCVGRLLVRSDDVDMLVGALGAFDPQQFGFDHQDRSLFVEFLGPVRHLRRSVLGRSDGRRPVFVGLHVELHRGNGLGEDDDR